MAAAVLDKDAFRALYPAEYFGQFAAKGLRPDRRSPGECRAATAVLNTIGSADASASCRLGDTFVTAGARLALATPQDTRPAEGSLEARVRLLSPSSSHLGYTFGRAKHVVFMVFVHDSRHGMLHADRFCGSWISWSPSHRSF
jgi:exosome complex RNA-binding protein Rrp42 (RNase PH superfamily)